MADLKKVLGTMLVSGLAGRTGGRGAALATAAPMLLGGGKNKAGMSFGSKAGLAALGYLAYKAYQEHKGSEQGSVAGTPAAQPAPAPAQEGSSGPFAPIFDALGIFQPDKKQAQPGAGVAGQGGGLGDRLASGLRGGGQQSVAEPEMDDAQALLLIRAMIAAANADGQITAEERQRILNQLDQAGAGAEERRIVEQEIRLPRSLDDVLRQVNDQDTAEQVYLASEIAIRGGSDTERRYLDFLASRLKISPDRQKELDSIT